MRNHVDRSAEGFIERRPAGPVEAALTEGPLRTVLAELRDHSVFVLSRTGRVLSWSSSAEAVHGYGAEEVIGQHLSMLFTAEDAAAGEPARQLEAARSGGAFEAEGWRVRRDGSRLWTSQVLTPLHDREGRLRGFGAVTRVLTDRMRVQDLLAVLDAATDAVLGVDTEGVIMFVNQAAADMFGYLKPELVGRLIEDLVPQRLRDRHPQRRQEYCHHPVPRVMGGGLRLSAVRRGGQEFPAEVSLSSVDTPRGPVVTALVRDLTAQRLAEADLQLDRERQRALFDHSPAGQAEATMDTRLVRVNAALERMLGYAEGELVGSAWRDLVHARHRRRLASGVEALLRGQLPCFAGGLWLLARRGDAVPALVSVSVLRDRDGRAQRLVAVAIDQRSSWPAPAGAAPEAVLALPGDAAGTTAGALAGGEPAAFPGLSASGREVRSARSEGRDLMGGCRSPWVGLGNRAAPLWGG